jgi:hypothetical protein
LYDLAIAQSKKSDTTATLIDKRTFIGCCNKGFVDIL